jgi:hypothetical protein
MNDGMAPLSLPEILDLQIPSARRVAILDELPAGVVGWSGEHLRPYLDQCLAVEHNDSVWIAAVRVLVREKSAQWFDALEGRFLANPHFCRTRKPVHFWGWLVFAAYMLRKLDPSWRDSVRVRLGRLESIYRNTSSGVGLRQMLRAVGRASGEEEISPRRE